MAEKTGAFVKLGDAGAAPILNYNVPDRTSYGGNNMIELDLPANLFRATLSQAPERAEQPRDPAQVASAAQKALSTGWFDEQVFPHARIRSNLLALADHDFATAHQAKASSVLAATGAPAQSC